jgi:hypothetical protein
MGSVLLLLKCDPVHVYFILQISQGKKVAIEQLGCIKSIRKFYLQEIYSEVHFFRFMTYLNQRLENTKMIPQLSLGNAFRNIFQFHDHKRNLAYI